MENKMKSFTVHVHVKKKHKHIIADCNYYDLVFDIHDIEEMVRKKIKEENDDELEMFDVINIEI